MAKKNKFSVSGPSVGDIIIDRATSGVDISQLPSSYNINQRTTDQTVVAELLEEPKEEVKKQSEIEEPGGYAPLGLSYLPISKSTISNFGEAVSDAVNNIGQLYQSIQKQRLSVGLSKLQDNLMETEARWLPQLEQAKKYLQDKQNFQNLNAIDQQNFNLLEQKIFESSKSNPYLQDLFYDVNKRTIDSANDIAINFKSMLNDFKDKNLFNVNPLDNVSTALKEGALNDEDAKNLWNSRQKSLSDSKRIELINQRLEEAQKEYTDKTGDIVKRQTTLKKGNWLYDPTSLTKEFQQKIDENELSITDPKSWFYATSNIGSSLSEIEMMFMQTGASILANKAARSLAVKSALGTVPVAGQIATGIAVGEQALNLWLAKYYRQSETASEVFDNYQSKILENIQNSPDILPKVYEEWKPQLQKLGYPVDQLDDLEVLNAGLAQGLTTDQPEFESIRSEAFNGLQMVRDVNDALSYSDYLQSMPFSYGGKILWNAANKSVSSARGLSKPLYKSYENIPTIADQLPLKDIAGKTIEKVLSKVSKNSAANITRKHILENVGKLVAANGFTAFSEMTEEGVQWNVGEKYKKGEYDNLKEEGVDPITAVANAGLLGIEAHLAYGGISNDNYMNTNQELKKSMDIGGFIGLIMPIAANVTKVKDISRQYASDANMQKIVAKGLDHAEKDNKIDVFLDAIKAGKDITYVHDYLESAKKFKQQGVTDEMIESDKKLATKLWSQYRNKAIDNNLRKLSIKKGSKLHDKFIKAYLHVSDRFEEADNSTNEVGRLLEEAIDNGRKNNDEVFNVIAQQSYEQYVNKQRKEQEQDIQFKLNATPEYAEEIEQEFQSSLVSFEQYSRAMYDLSYAKLQYDTLTKLNDNLSKRKKTLKDISDNTGIRTNLEGVNNIREYVKSFQERLKEKTNAIAKQYGFNDLSKWDLELSNSEQLKQYITAYTVNKAIRDRLQEQVQMYITGKLNISKYRDINGVYFKDLSPELQEIELANRRSDLFKNGELNPSDKQIISKYNYEQSANLFDLERQADINNVETELANRVIYKHINDLYKKERVARNEKVDEGELIDDTDYNPVDFTESIEPIDVDKKPLTTKEPVSPVINAERTIQDKEPVDKIIEKADDEALTAIEIIEKEKRKLDESRIDYVKDEMSEEDKSLVDNMLTQESEIPDSSSAQEALDIMAETDKVIFNNETNTDDGLSASQFEELDSKLNSVTVDQTTGEESVIIQGKDDTVAIIDKTDSETDNIPTPPVIDKTQNDNVEESTIKIVDGGIYVNDGSLFVSDEKLFELQQILEDPSPEIYGETGYANMNPRNITSNSDALTNNKLQKVKHIANTFFFQPDSNDPMKVTVNGKPVTFTDNNGKELKVLPGSQLSKRLLQKDWINNVNSYYIVTNHKRGDQDVYQQAVHLVLEDKDGVFIASLRTPDYVDKQIQSGEYNAEQVRQLQDQKDKLIQLRFDIVNAYLGTNKTFPSTLIKTVKPKKLRISNGEFNNQKTQDNAPKRQKVTEITQLGLSNNVRELDKQLQDGAVDFGYGTGEGEWTFEQNVVRRLSDGSNVPDAKGRAGAIYLIPNPEQVPTGNVVPIQLNIAKLDSGIFGNDIQLSNSNAANSIAEFVYKVLTKQIDFAGASNLLDILVNSGSSTIIGREAGEKYPFLLEKMLYVNDILPDDPTIQFAVKNSNGVYTRVEFPIKRANEQQKKLAIAKIAKDLHWNTDKELLSQPIHQNIVNICKTYFEQNPNAQVFKFWGLDDLSFSREDIGFGYDDKPVTLLAWMINTGKIQTDLGETLYRAPFIYTDGVNPVTVTEETIAQNTQPEVKQVENKITQDKTPTSDTVKEQTAKNNIELVSTDENWSEDQIKEWMSINTPQYKYIPGKWQVVRIKGVMKVASNMANRKGLASTIKGKGSVSVSESKKWLKETLGISESDVVTSTAVFRMAGAKEVYGAVKVCLDALSNSNVARIYLSEQAGQGIEYHEGFHYVSNLLLDEDIRNRVYQDYVNAHPELKNATKLEVEEALAEEFRQYMIDENKPSIVYRIKKAFNAIKTVLGITRDGNVVKKLFKNIREGQFSKYQPSNTLLNEFKDRFSGQLYYYVPGIEDSKLKKMQSISDSSTFYQVVDSLNSTVMDMFKISSLEDLETLGTKINDIFDDVLSTNLELGLYDEYSEQLIRDVVNNKDVFKSQIEAYLRNFSIVKKNTEEHEESVKAEIEGGGVDNSWDKESYTISKKANVAFKAKLFFYSIPKSAYIYEQFTDPETGKQSYVKQLVHIEDELLHTTVSEDFNVTWNKVLDNLWNVDSYIDLVDKCYLLGKTDPFFQSLYNKLTSTIDPLDEVTKTQILNTVKSAKNSLTALVVKKNTLAKWQEEKLKGSDAKLEHARKEAAKQLNWRVQDSNVYTKISRTPKRWSNTFFLSDLIKVNEEGQRVINHDKFKSVVASHKTKIDQLLNTKDSSKELELFTEVRNHFIEMCNNLSIEMDDLTIDYMLNKINGRSDLSTFKRFWNDQTTNSFIKDIYSKLEKISRKGAASLKGKESSVARSLDRIYTSSNQDAQINLMALSWGMVHPTPEEFSVTGADGSLVYPITENNYMSDQLRWLKYNLNDKRNTLQVNPYSASSKLLKHIIENPDIIKLHTYLNLEEDSQNTNRDYFGISPLEDYISKLVFGHNDHMFCPTMSDKKTWHTISGVKMVHDFLASTKQSTKIVEGEQQQIVDIFTPVERKFSKETIDLFKQYFTDELNAIKTYYANKQKVKDNSNLRVDNYYGSEKGKFADGNGGRFRYFNIIEVNGELFNLNEQLAKAEYINDTVAIQKILSAAEKIVTSDRSDENINKLLLDYAQNEINQAIELGVINSDLTNKNLPLNIVKSYEDNYKDISVQNKEKDIIYSIIASHAINSAISTIEIEKCFTGDPALYKWLKQLVVYKPGDPSFTPKIAEKNLESWLSDNNIEEDDRSQYSAYYMITGRDVDKIKRLSSVLSTGTNLRTKFGENKYEEDSTDTSFQILQLTDSEIGSTVYDTLYDMFKQGLVKEMYQKQFNISDAEALAVVKDKNTSDKALQQIRDVNPKLAEFIETQAKASARPYSDGQINQADAAVYIRPEFYKRLMISLGEWSPEIAEAYDIMESGDKWLNDPELYKKAIKAITQPLKMVYFGDRFDANIQLNVNTFDKMALFPLFKTFAKADNKALYDRMNDTSKGTIDMVAFESAIKVGGRKKLSYYKNGKINIDALNAISDKDGMSGSGLATYTQELSQLRLQLNTEPHEHLNRSFGTQAIKIGFANVVDERPYGGNKGLSIKGKDIKHNIISAINNLSRIGKDKVINEFYTNGKIDNRKVVDYLQRQAINSGMSAEIVSNLTVDSKGNIVVPIEAQSIRGWIQTKITSFTNKSVIDVNTPGGSAIQMSSFGYEAVGKDITDDPELAQAFNNGKKLNFLAKEGHMQVILSENFFKDILPKELRDASFYTKRAWLIEKGIIGTKDGIESKPYGVGYRIPTQGLSSMFSFSVADIMPTTIGDTIIVPEEFTAMTGSDFDVDKLYLATYAYDKDGIRTDSTEDSENGYVNKLLDNYSLVLTDFTNIAETRASIDTLTKTLQKKILPVVKKVVISEARPMYELSPSFQLSRKTEYTGGKAGIAPFALNSTHHAMSQFTHLNMYYSHNNKYNLGSLDAILGEDNQRIMDWLSAMVNAHVDVAKDPYIMDLNVNAITYNMTSLLLRGGKGQSTFYFLAQPALKRFTKESLEGKGIIGVQKQISEEDRLRNLITEYIDKLYNAINTNVDKDYTQYKQYYNRFAMDYDRPRYAKIDAVKSDPTVVFNTVNASNALANQNSVESLHHQVLSLIAYKELLSDAQTLGDLVQLSQIDTKKFGNTLPLQLNFKRRLSKFKQKNSDKFYITDNDGVQNAVEYFFNETFLQRKLNDGVNLPRMILKNQVIEATYGYEKMFNAVCDKFLGNSSNQDLVKELSDILTTSLRTKAVVNNIDEFNISDQKLLNMLKGNNSMAKQLTRLKQYLRKTDNHPELAFKGTIKNELLNYLQEYASDGTDQFYDRIVTIDNALSKTATYENRLLSAYQELLESDNEHIREFANDLAIFSYLTSFDNRSPNSFFDVITTQWKKEKGYPTVIESAIQVLNNQNMAGMEYFGFDSQRIANGNYTEIFTEIARNSVRNDRVVPTYELYTPQTESDAYLAENKYNSKFYIKTGVAPIPSIFSTWKSDDPFVKIYPSTRFPDLIALYQKVGEYYQLDGEGNEVKNTRQNVYKIIPALGTVDDKKIYYEYNKMPNEQSVFEQNSLPREAIHGNIEVESIVREEYKDKVKKAGTIFVYESTDAINISTSEKQYINTFESPEQTQFGNDLEDSNETVNSQDTDQTPLQIVDTDPITTIVGDTTEDALTDTFTDIDNTPIIITDDMVNFTDEYFGEDSVFDMLMDTSITDEVPSVESMLDTYGTTEEVQDKFSDEAYNFCKGK